MKWTTDKVRQSFLDFFKERGHTIVPSASLVPRGDPTLLFTNAGMVQFKDYFLGIRTPPYPRVADCQKCLRISGKHNDLEAVGRDTYHHTFFEMLGNWSFGDYYKKEAIEWHWELITRVWGIDPGRLYATVYKDDDEAEQVWLKLGVLPRDRIMRFGRKDNFWEMGETGPCGPCSEIHIDRGDSACDRGPHPGVECGVNVDGCERYIELANLVFIEYNRLEPVFTDRGAMACDKTGHLEPDLPCMTDLQGCTRFEKKPGPLKPLPMKHVDTGTGLERVAAVLQGLETGRVLGNYDIDVFQKIIQATWRSVEQYRADLGYGVDAAADVSYRAIADHARAASFLIAEGLLPANSDRSYVPRRLIRRALRHGRKLGIAHSFLSNVCLAVEQAMGQAYPELVLARQRIADEVEREEWRFEETLDRGLEVFNSERDRVQKARGKSFSAEVAFKLYDTYGFPLDLTQDIAREQGFTVDVEEFDRLMGEQRERARAARKGEAELPQLKIGDGTASRFVGYDHDEVDSQVTAVNAGEGGELVLAVRETPFYAESGGQVGDRGVIEAESGALFEVVDTKKSGDSIVHVGRLLRGEPGEFEPGKRVTLRVDRTRREAAMLNHSATHILHYALRDILGAETHQQGSLVDPNHLRFDFNHQGPVSESDLQTIEEEINARIRENAKVETREMAYEDAIRSGALAFFGDKYGDQVRVVRMGDFSVELCGGTHVSRTGDVGIFKLGAESGVASGVRRIEAVTGQGALAAIRERERILDEIGERLGSRDAAALKRLEKLVEREKELERKLRRMEQKLAAGGGGAGGAENVREVGGVKVVTRKVEGIEVRTLREMADAMRLKHQSAVVALGSDLGNKALLLVAVTPDLSGRIRAGDVIRRIAPVVGGSGGGRAELAQAGGRDPAKLGEALEQVASVLGEN